MEIKVYVSGQGEEMVFPSLNLYDALDTAREFLDMGSFVEISIGGNFFRMLNDGPYLRATPIPQDSSPSSAGNPNLSTNPNPGGTIA